MSTKEEREKREGLAVFLSEMREAISAKQNGNKVLIRSLAAHEDEDWETLLRLVKYLHGNLLEIRDAEYEIQSVLSFHEMTEEEVLT